MKTRIELKKLQEGKPFRLGSMDPVFIKLKQFDNHSLVIAADSESYEDCFVLPSNYVVVSLDLIRVQRSFLNDVLTGYGL